MLRQESSDFLRQKQAQWEKEKAESESRQEWFPFGTKVTPERSPPKRSAPKESTDFGNRCDEASVSNTSSPTMDGKQSIHNGKPSESSPHQHQYHVPPMTSPLHPHHPHPYSYPVYTYPYPIPPYHPHHQMTSSTASGTADVSEDNTNRQQYFAPHYQVIPAGAIPVSTINVDPSQLCPVDQMGMWTLPPPVGKNGMLYGIPIPAPLVPQITASIMEASKNKHSTHNNPNTMTSSTSSNDSSSESGVSGVKEITEIKNKKRVQEEKEIRHEDRQSTSDYTDDDPIPLTRRSTTGSLTYNYADQIAERRRFEQEQEDRERQELLEVERQRRILEDRRASEEEMRKRNEKERFEEEKRRADQFAAAMQKAQKEAELLKRAKLYKHVLLGAEEEGGTEQLGEMEKKLLGVDIETGKRLLKEVSEVEWHKKQDEAEMRKSSPQKNVHNNSCMNIGNQSNRGRSSSMSSPEKVEPSFTRNSVGRRSVRTLSREKQQTTVSEQERGVNDSMNSFDPALPLLQSSTPVSLPNQPASPVCPKGSRITAPQAQGAHLGNRKVSLPTESDMMLKSGGYYCPMNRDPLSHREEVYALNKTNNFAGGLNNNNKFEGGVRRYNETTQSALFGPIATRSSIRRGTMRGTALPSPTSIHISHQNQDGNSSFDDSNSGGEDFSVSPDFNQKNFDSSLPSTENVHPESPPTKMNDEFEYKTPSRARSALSSPMTNLLNGSDNNSPVSRPASRLMQRLEQKGPIRRDDEFISQEIRRVAETNLSRSPSMASLRGSIQNLSLRGSHLNLAGSSGELPPNLTKFASVNSPARQSLSSMKKTTDRQAAVLERLGRLRESLHAGKNYTPPRPGFTSSRITTPAQTPPISPRPIQ